MKIELFSPGPNDPGFLATIDGPNGSGKTFLTEAVVKELKAAGVAVHSTRQPSPTVLGNLVRNAETELRGRSLACLVAADRRHQVETEIALHLKAGDIVLCDRYVESSLVLQRLDNVDTEFILRINAGIPRPDLRIRLGADPETIRARLRERQPNPRRRFEQNAGPERELKLYEEADRLLGEDYGLEAKLYDTTHTDAEELGANVARLIEQSRGADD